MKTEGSKFTCPSREIDEGGLFVSILIKVVSTFAASLKGANPCQVVLEPTSPSFVKDLALADTSPAHRESGVRDQLSGCGLGHAFIGP